MSSKPEDEKTPAEKVAELPISPDRTPDEAKEIEEKGEPLGDNFV